MNFQLLFLLALISSSAFSQQAEMRYFRQPIPLSPASTPYGNNPKAGHYTVAGDARIYYEVYGKGKPLVILHGGIVGSTYHSGDYERQDDRFGVQRWGIYRLFLGSNAP